MKIRPVVGHHVGREGDNFGEGGAALTDLYADVELVAAIVVVFAAEALFCDGLPGVTTAQAWLQLAGHLASVP
jgi:hypothetical protein